jgi:hypothetical protein
VSELEPAAAGRCQPSPWQQGQNQSGLMVSPLCFSTKEATMRELFEDFLMPIIGLLAVLAVFFAIAIGVGAIFDSYQCSRYEKVTGKPTQYEGLSCYVQDGGSWYAWTEYKHRLATKGEFQK